MSNNNVPSAPNHYYYRKTMRAICPIEPVLVWEYNGVLMYEYGGSFPVQDDGLWAGPVPMPGEWAPMDLFNQLWAELSKTSPTRGSSAADILHRARAWDDPEAAP